MNKTNKFENFHILLWLIKDMSWLMGWKFFGMFMIAPTMMLAIFITWKNRQIKSELFHNLAIICWIAANSFWMTVEFFAADESLKSFAIIPYLLGLMILIYYYAAVLNKKLVKRD